MEILTHPLFLLMVGGLITGGLFPWLARQRYREAFDEMNERYYAFQSALLDVQSGLIGDILREPARPLRPGRSWLAPRSRSR
ncbi:MAG: hypothetical protein ACRDNE_04305 [Gaiellaceae bacterium]